MLATESPDDLETAQEAFDKAKAAADEAKAVFDALAPSEKNAAWEDFLWYQEQMFEAAGQLADAKTASLNSENAQQDAIAATLAAERDRYVPGGRLRGGAGRDPRRQRCGRRRGGGTGGQGDESRVGGGAGKR